MGEPDPANTMPVPVMCWAEDAKVKIHFFLNICKQPVWLFCIKAVTYYKLVDYYTMEFGMVAHGNFGVQKKGTYPPHPQYLLSWLDTEGRISELILKSTEEKWGQGQQNDSSLVPPVKSCCLIVFCEICSLVDHTSICYFQALKSLRIETKLKYAEPRNSWSLLCHVVLPPCWIWDYNWEMCWCIHPGSFQAAYTELGMRRARVKRQGLFLNGGPRQIMGADTVLNSEKRSLMGMTLQLSGWKMC